MNKDKLIEYLNFVNEVNVNPNSEPFVILASYETWHPLESGESGLYDEIISYRTFMVSLESKELAMQNLNYEGMYFDGMGHFDKDDKGKNKYVTGESWEHFDGLILEPLYIFRYWAGLSLNIYEPSQRVINYLNLHNQDNVTEWIDPYKNQIVIRILKEESASDYVKHTLKKIEIKIDYLKDYLSARESGLIVTKYARRSFLFDSPDDVPLKNIDIEINKGTISFVSTSGENLLSQKTKGKTLGQAELHQKFWIDPFRSPRRWDAQSASEFKGDVKFILHDGEERTYNVKAGHNEDYFKLISLNQRVMSIFISTLNYDFEEFSRETLGLKFPNGATLHVAINPSGQIQAWWGLIAKLRKEYQEKIAQYSEPWISKLSAEHDYIRTTMYGIFPQTKPLRQTLEKLKSDINEYFLSEFKESFFNKSSSVKDLAKIYEPYEPDYHQLLDIMEQLDKWLFSESRPNKIIEHYHLADEIDDVSQLPKIKSLVTLKLLIKKYLGNEEAENRTAVLKIIKDLRICKAHYKDLSKLLDKHKLAGESSQDIYKKIIGELEEFMEWFLYLCQNKFFPNFKKRVIKQ